MSLILFSERNRFKAVIYFGGSSSVIHLRNVHIFSSSMQRVINLISCVGYIDKTHDTAEVSAPATVYLCVGKLVA